LRALVAKVRREGLQLDRVVTICADCLGTYPADDYSWRAKRIGSSEQLSQETLQFARLGGIAAYRYRSACQVCASPVGDGADLNIGVFGLPVRQHILVEARDQATAMRLGMDTLPVVVADPAIVLQREHTVAKLVQRHNQTRERVLHGLGELLPDNIEALIQQLQDCAECRECFNSCPICVGEFPQRGIDGSILRDDILQWMVSCAGCGMCEQVCPTHKPLGTIFAYIREQLASIGSELDYAI
jgi:ferredoxin